MRHVSGDEIYETKQHLHLARLRLLIDDALTPLIPAGSRCAIIGYPAHGNVGDSAIWLGERRWLRNRGCDLVYECDPSSYKREHLASFGEDVILLLNGGGNLGDIWPAEQHLRERLLADFPANRVIQLPQSVWFEDSAALARAQPAMRRHRSLTLLCRDNDSLERGAALCDDVRLCPDMAFALDDSCLDAERPPADETVWLCRNDRETQSTESLRREAQRTGATPRDWVTDPPSALIEERWRLARSLRFGRGHWRPLRERLTHIDALLARQRLDRGCRLLASGGRVVTDRLHGHVLSLLLGVPNVLVDSGYGKSASLYETWTHTLPISRLAVSASEAARRLEELPKREVEAPPPATREVVFLGDTRSEFNDVNVFNSAISDETTAVRTSYAYEHVPQARLFVIAFDDPGRAIAALRDTEGIDQRGASRAWFDRLCSAVVLTTGRPRLFVDLTRPSESDDRVRAPIGDELWQNLQEGRAFAPLTTVGVHIAYAPASARLHELLRGAAASGSPSQEADAALTHAVGALSAHPDRAGHGTLRSQLDRLADALTRLERAYLHDGLALTIRSISARLRGLVGGRR